MLAFRALALLISVLTIHGAALAVSENEPEICKKLREIGGSTSKWSTGVFKTREQECRHVFWYAFKPKALSEILDHENLAAYRRALDESKCLDAERILRTGFVGAHPDAPSIVDSEDDFKEWRKFPVAKYFSDLYLCSKLAEIERQQAEIDRQGIKAAPFFGLERSLPSGASRHMARPLLKRHHAVNMLLLSLPVSRNPKIGLALLKLSIEGKTLKFTPLHEMYLANRLVAYGVDDPLVSEVLERPLVGDKKDLFERIKKDGWPKELPVFGQ